MLPACVVAPPDTHGRTGDSGGTSDGYSADRGDVEDAAADDRRPDPIPVAAVSPPVRDPAPEAPRLEPVWIPGVGEILFADIEDLIFGDSPASPSELPLGFNYLELLCRDQGFSDAYCRSRFSGW